MRITRYRDLHSTAGYCNPETEAMARNKLFPIDSRFHANRGEAYRSVIDELFTNYAFPGGYPIIFTTDAGDCLCAKCAKKVYLDDRTDIACGTYDEGPTMYCDGCNCEIESSYGDPDEEKE